MSQGIRVEVAIDDPEGCTVAQASGAADGAVDTVSRAVDPEAADTVTEEFVLEGDLGGSELPDELQEVFRYGPRSVYRFERELGRMCPCECVEAHKCPVVDVHTRGSELYLVFHAPDMQTLQAAVQELRDRYPSLDVRRMLRSATDSPGESVVFLDRGKLTDRQREVLETAHEMGYFDHPKEVNAGEVAEALDISPSTFSEHLAAAQRKLMDDILAVD